MSVSAKREHEDPIQVLTPNMLEALRLSRHIMALRVYIMPAVAAVMLEHNYANRNLRPRPVDAFARDIAAGRWYFNGEAISYDWQGRLRDGQHRLAAVVKAGIGIDTLVVFGLDPASVATIDTGTARLARHTLQMGGTANASYVAGAARILWYWDRGSFSSKVGKPTHMEIMAMAESRPMLLAAAHFVAGRSPLASLLSPSLATALFVVFAQIDGDACRRFFESLSTGAALDMGSPILALRHRLEARRGATTRDGQVYLAAITIRAWNAWRDGRPLSRVIWDPQDAFPVPR